MKAKVITKVTNFVEGTVYSHCNRVHEIHTEAGDVIESRKRLNELREMYDITDHKIQSRKRQVEE